MPIRLLFHPAQRTAIQAAKSVDKRMAMSFEDSHRHCCEAVKYSHQMCLGLVSGRVGDIQTQFYCRNKAARQGDDCSLGNRYQTASLVGLEAVLSAQKA